MIEHTTKRKRGRPAVFDKSRLETTSFVFNGVKTKRGLQNNTYALDALSILKKKTKPEILDYYFSEKSIKTSILSELGRLAYSLIHTNLSMEKIEELLAGTAEELYMLHKEHGFKVKGLIGVCIDIRLNR